MTTYLVAYLLGVLFGGISMKLFNLHKRSGNIMVTQDEDGTYLTLQIKSMADITTNKEVTLGVITQK